MVHCSNCGKTTKPGCDCGVAYLPAHVFAAKAVKANPQLSDRAIAEKIGVAPNTVRKARKATAQKCAVEKRTGRDGKARKMPSRQMTPELANAMRARAEAVTAMFGPGTKRIPAAARKELLIALNRYAPPLVETIRKRLNLKWDDLLVPAAHENESPVRVATAA